MVLAESKLFPERLSCDSCLLLFASEALTEFKSRLAFSTLRHIQIPYRQNYAAYARMDNPYSVLTKMSKAQWLPRRKLEERVIKKLRNILSHAYHNVPFYRELYTSAAADPLRVKNLEALNRLPIVRKEMMRSARTKLLARDIPANLILDKYTSGSSGDPFHFYLSRNWGPWRWASKWLFDSYFGARPQSRYFRFLPAELSDRPPNIHAANFLEKIGIALNLTRIDNDLLISGFSLSETAIPTLLRKISSFKPKYGSGTPSLLTLLAELMERAVHAEFPNMLAIVSTAETLNQDDRRRIEDAFGCAIFERYGSREFYGAVAGECEFHSGLHVNEELSLVEIVDENGENCAEGEVGTILITDLHNRCMPFIRYEVGDSAIWSGSCKCGRQFSTMREISGRVVDFTETKDGRRLPIRMLGTMGMVKEKMAEFVRYYQFVQDRPGHLTLRVIPDRPISSDLHCLMKAKLKRMEEQVPMDFDLEIVQHLEKLPSGKRAVLLKRAS